MGLGYFMVFMCVCFCLLGGSVSKACLPISKSWRPPISKSREASFQIQDSQFPNLGRPSFQSVPFSFQSVLFSFQIWGKSWFPNPGAQFPNPWVQFPNPGVQFPNPGGPVSKSWRPPVSKAGFYPTPPHPIWDKSCLSLGQKGANKLKKLGKNWKTENSRNLT